MSIEDEIEELRRKSCDHVCHKRGLNPWIKECPHCYCPNPAYDPGAVSDIDPPRIKDFAASLGLLAAIRQGE